MPGLMLAWGCGSCGQVCARGQSGGSVFCRGRGGELFSGVLASEQRPLGSNPLSVESMGRAFLTEVKARRLRPACLWAQCSQSGE